MRIGIIGTGNIATFLLKTIEREKRVDSHLRIVSPYGRNNKVGAALATSYGVNFYSEMEEFLHSPVDIVVEAATVEAAKEWAEKVLQRGKDLLLSSVGAMADRVFNQKIRAVAERHDGNVYLPSGAIGGIDLIQSANALGELEKVSLTTRKSPRSLGLGDDVEGEVVVFEGKAEEAITRFPKNTNVSIILSLAGVGVENTEVIIVADSQVERNSHTIEAEGAFGSFQLQVENEPMPDNPKTSYLAALSILATLQNVEQSVRLGNG